MLFIDFYIDIFRDLNYLFNAVLLSDCLNFKKLVMHKHVVSILS